MADNDASLQPVAPEQLAQRISFVIGMLEQILGKHIGITIILRDTGEEGIFCMGNDDFKVAATALLKMDGVTKVLDLHDPANPIKTKH